MTKYSFLIYTQTVGSNGTPFTHTYIVTVEINTDKPGDSRVIARARVKAENVLSDHYVEKIVRSVFIPTAYDVGVEYLDTFGTGRL